MWQRVTKSRLSCDLRSVLASGRFNAYHYLQANRRDQANRALGEADAILTTAKATADSIRVLADAIAAPVHMLVSTTFDMGLQGGKDAVALKVAQEVGLHCM